VCGCARTGRRLSQRFPTGSSPDPIGWASARLYAGGVERQQRLATLRFLGILLETADAEGHVHCDPDDLAGLGLLHGLEADEVARSRGLLEAFGVLDREETGWRIRHFAPVGDEVPPAEVMAAIGRALAKPVDGHAPAEPAGRAPAAAAVVAMEPARARRARRWMAAPVSAAAAAAVVLVALMVSGQVRVPLVSSPVSHSQQNAVGAGSAPSSTPSGTPATGSSPVGSPSPSAGAATAPTIGQTPTGTSAALGAEPAPAVCPVGGVSATVDHMDQHLDSAAPSTSLRASLPPFVHTSVSGVVHNNSAAAVVVNPFPVTVNFTDPAGKTSRSVTATALSAPTSIAPGASIPWSVTVDNPQDAPVPGTANAAPPTWRWDDARLASLCPH